MGENFKAMSGIAFRTSSENCLAGMRFYLFDFPEGSWSKAAQNTVYETIGDHGGTVALPATDLRLRKEDIGVFADVLSTQTIRKMTMYP